MLQRSAFNLYVALVIVVLLLSPSLGKVTGKCEKCRFGVWNSLQKQCAERSKPWLKCKLKACKPFDIVPAARAIDIEDSASGRQIAGPGSGPGSGPGPGLVPLYGKYQCCCEEDQEEYCKANCNCDSPPPTCSLAAICYAVDESGSVRLEGFNKQKKFVLDSASRINLDYGSSVHYSMVEFNSEARLTQSLTNKLYTEFVPSVNQATFQDGGTNIAAGLTECYRDMKNQFVGKNRVIVLLTDGRGTGSSSIVSTIKRDKIGVITVGIGSSVDEQYLKEVATAPKYYFPTSFDDIETISKKAVARTCELVNSGVIDQSAKEAQNGTTTLTPFSVGIEHDK